MNMITYEEKRSLIKKVIKQNLNLTFNEIVILDKLLYINKESIEAVELKRLLYSQNTPISIQINNLIELGLLKNLEMHMMSAAFIYIISTYLR
ncbi:MarR family transcriptional regulator [Staphylococcus sp. IPLA37010]|uniref:MarR family transcriptional regulator n=1 Tax=Staphylococcus equorum TaxID=246432 RepID=A0AAW7AHR8_9STAP|nr:MarR family transcriptional regulator [Staphylococcus equorum]MDK9865743.1 MarR family transcriptional regulator [Staphylococcus equorum]